MQSASERTSRDSSSLSLRALSGNTALAQLTEFMQRAIRVSVITLVVPLELTNSSSTLDSGGPERRAATVSVWAPLSGMSSIRVRMSPVVMTSALAAEPFFMIFCTLCWPLASLWVTMPIPPRTLTFSRCASSASSSASSVSAWSLPLPVSASSSSSESCSESGASASI